MRQRRRPPVSWTSVLAALMIAAAWTHGARAQAVPDAGPELAPSPARAAVAREAQLEERLKRMEARYEEMDRKHAEEMERSQALSLRRDREIEELRAMCRSLTERLESPSPPKLKDAGDREGAGGEAPRTAEDVSRLGGAGARDNPAQDTAGSKGGAPSKVPVTTKFGPGLEWTSQDEEFQLQFHNETQIEARIYEQAHQTPVHGGFFFPRQRWIFSGRVSKPIEFYTSFRRDYSTLDVTDLFLNFHYDDRFMVKIGRMKAPYTYEYYAISNQDLPAPERSLFTSNFSRFREIGIMGWGQVLDKKLDYAAGFFNGSQRFLQDFDFPNDLVAYLNARPFQGRGEGSPLENLNLGASVVAGNQNTPAIPAALFTSVNTASSPNVSNASPAFLKFNQNVLNRGERSMWAAHLAYYYKGLSLLGEWDAGNIDYALSGRAARTHLPVGGYFVQAAYFVTGETVSRRTQVVPLRPFDIRRGKRGPGAIELQARYSQISLGERVFTDGLADPNLWTNQASTVDIGFNWYLSRYMKIYFDWQHAVFGQPVLYRPGGLQKTSDLLWIRWQLYF